MLNFKCLKTKYQKLLTKEEEKKCLELMLLGNFPLKTYIICLTINMLLGFCAIGFQFGLISVKGPLYFVGAGLWVGLIMIICESIGFVLGSNFSNLLLEYLFLKYSFNFQTI